MLRGLSQGHKTSMKLVTITWKIVLYRLSKSCFRELITVHTGANVSRLTWGLAFR